MADNTCSKIAIAASMPPVTATEDVEVRVLYDPFKPESVEVHRFDYREGSLADFLGDLPDAEYMLFHNGTEVVMDQADQVTVQEGDSIGLVVLPLGGRGFKSVLRVVMQVAMIGVMFIPGIGQLAAAAISIGLGLVSAFLLTPKPPKSSQQNDDRSYGIDGAKNSATEGIVYPVVYGSFRMAGNFSDTYTENVGDNQYLYLRTVLNDGLADSISDIEINEQPIANFTDVQSRVSLGSLTAEPNDWFRSSIRQVNKGVKIDTGWVAHLTTQEVDQVRFDVVFPAGLVSINEKKGTYRSKTVTLQTEYRRVNQDGSPYAGVQGQWQGGEFDGPDNDIVGETTQDRQRLFFGLTRPASVKIEGSVNVLSSNPGSAPVVQYRSVGSSSWSDVLNYNLDSFGSDYIPDESLDGSIYGPTDITPTVSRFSEFELPPGQYEVRGVNGAEVERVSSYPSSGSQTLQVTDSRTRAIRRSFTSQRLERGYYQVRIRRTTPTSTDQYEVDEVFLSDVAEIDAEPVALRGTANLSLRIKLNEQLSNIPQLTSLVKGSVLQEYDRQGNPTVKRWSANPAWVAIDIMSGEQRGGGISLSRIDWPRWVEYAEWCEANSIEFNGVFAESSNVGDAVRQVLRIGRALPVPLGTKISVAIDRPRQPLMLFTQASMVEKSFSISYLSMQDRSNEFEVTYYDKMDRNKAKTIRYVDPKAVTFNETPKTAQVSLVGVDSVQQAREELWRMIYQNRLLVRTLSFETLLESANLTIGDVALIQHDMMNWANNGRLAAGSTASSIKLDQRVERLHGTNYSMLVHFSAISRLSGRQVSSVVGSKVMFASNGQALTPDQLRSNRLVASNGQDYEILSVESGSAFHSATLVSPPTGLNSSHTITLFQTDAVEERAVSNVTQNPDGTSSVTLSTPLPVAPEQYSNFVYGEVTRVRKPYVLTGVSGNGLEKRRLTFIEYNEGVYAPPEVDIPIPVEQVNDRIVDHVRGLLFDYDRIVDANRKTTNVRLFWNADTIRNYGGADIFMRLNGSAWTAVGSAANVSEFNMQLTPGDVVQFRVNAYSTRGDRAPLITAPIVGGTLAVQRATLDPPRAFSAVMSGFEVDGTVAYAFTPPVDTTGVEAYEIEVRHVSDVTWFSLGRFNGTSHVQTGVPPGSYLARVRSVSTDSISVWVETGFAVTVLPGSLLANFSSGNDRNPTPIPAPTLPAIGSVEHTINKDGSANISLEWLWNGNEGDIDGFRITMTQS